MLSTRAAQRVAKKKKKKKLLTSPFPGILNGQLEVGKSSKWVVGVPMIVPDLLHNGEEDGIFGHPFRDPLPSAAMIQWFPYNTNCHVVTWSGPLTEIVSHVSGTENRVLPP